MFRYLFQQIVGTAREGHLSSTALTATCRLAQDDELVSLT